MSNSIREKIKDNPSYPWLIFTFIAISGFISNFNTSSLSIAMPIFDIQFSVDQNISQWVLTGYLLIVVGILPFIGKLSDMMGRKRIFIIGLVIFLIGSVVAIFSSTIYQLIAFRILQGLGGGILQGNTMAIISSSFKKGSRGKALGIIGGVVAFGTVAGPVFGGLLIDLFTWHALFWVNIPFIVISLIESMILLPKDYKKPNEKLDYLGSIYFFIFMVLLILYLSTGKIWNFTSIYELTIIFISLLFFILFIMRERKITHPIIDFSFFKSSTFTIGNILVFISYALLMFPTILLTYYLNEVWGLKQFKYIYSNLPKFV